MTPPTLGLDEDELVACVACGLCLPACPTYRVTGMEIASPRGRIAAMQAVQLGRAPLDDEFTDAMDACLVCRGCEVACPSGVQFGHLMEGARAAIRPRRPFPRRVVEWFAYRIVLPHHAVLIALTWVLAIAQRVRLVPRRFGLPKISLRSLRTPLVADPRPDSVLFTGVRDGRVATRCPPIGPSRDARGRCTSRAARRGFRLLRRAARARRLG